MFTRGQKVVIYAAGVLTLVFAGVTTWMELRPAPPALPQYWALPAFSLTNQDGQPVTLENFKGKVWLADFIYTTCPGQCPLITAHMARLQQKLPADADVRIASFSTDPQTDTPPVLKAYARKYAASDRWTFLTGPKDRVYDLIEHGFKLPISAPVGAQIVHSTRIMLVDRKGNVRTFYDGLSQDGDDQIIADIKKLLQESP